MNALPQIPLRDLRHSDDAVHSDIAAKNRDALLAWWHRARRAGVFTDSVERADRMRQGLAARAWIFPEARA